MTTLTSLFPADNVNRISYVLTNPGAETGDTSGWTVDTGSWRVTGPGHTGTSSFAGGPTAVESAVYQDIAAVSGPITPARIDAGTVWVTAGWWQSSWSGSDQACVRLQFFDGVPALIPYRAANGTLLAVPATEGDTWWYRSIGAQVPAGTRTIRIFLVNQRVAGTNCDAYMDDITLEGIWAI